VAWLDGARGPPESGKRLEGSYLFEVRLTVRLALEGGVVSGLERVVAVSAAEALLVKGLALNRYLHEHEDETRPLEMKP
jgi:hypothetical protein